ncbi:hypothetical protein LINGRAHAP2_LOCUS30344 [Linum grandiflorum]
MPPLLFASDCISVLAFEAGLLLFSKLPPSNPFSPDSDSDKTGTKISLEKTSSESWAAKNSTGARSLEEFSGPILSHIAIESTDTKRLADFYEEIFGFEEIETPNFGFNVIWLNLANAFSVHLIERSPETKLPEGQYSAQEQIRDVTHLARGYHICISVANFDVFVQYLKVSIFSDVLLHLPLSGQIKLKMTTKKTKQEKLKTRRIPGIPNPYYGF